MKASELRIGNYVYLISEGHEDEPNLVEWSLEDFSFYEGVMFSIEPILLTEEWLLKFGFIIHNKPNGYTEYIKYKEGTKQYLHKIFTFKESDNDWKGKFGFTGTIQTKIEYVHQLQNLYFALTNEELIIK